MGEPRLPVYREPVSAGHVAMAPAPAVSRRLTHPASVTSVEGLSSVGQILQSDCLCGGDNGSPAHPESLMHRSWLWRLAVVNMDSDPGAPAQHFKKEVRKGALQVANLPLE